MKLNAYGWWESIYICGNLQRRSHAPVIPKETDTPSIVPETRENNPIEENGSVFKGYRWHHLLQDVRSVLDGLLIRPVIYSAAHILYANHFDDGSRTDILYSDGDYTGLALIFHVKWRRNSLWTTSVWRVACREGFVHVRRLWTDHVIELCYWWLKAQLRTDAWFCYLTSNKL